MPPNPAPTPPYLPLTPTPHPRNWHLKDELTKRDRELAKLVVRILSLQEVLAGYRRGPPAVARYAHATTTTTTTHAAFTGFARSMAYL
jgi:hypothetical protein